MQHLQQRILCIEDDEDTCEMLTVSLEMSGYEVEVANTAAEALAKASTQHFDILLLDNRLPDRSGIELCKQIREFGIHIPIIFYSGDAYPAQIESAMKAGAQAYLVKPVYGKDLNRTIGQLIN
jgi:two-component system, OmpR family, alkaline phosphatase synthesis response regulator PhoP